MASQTTSHETAFLHWDRHGYLAGVASFPVGYPCELIEEWRRRVAGNAGLTVEAGLPIPHASVTRKI